MQPQDAIQKAIELCGGTQALLAKQIGRTQQLVSMLVKGAPISAEVALKIETATKGEVPAHSLRPDLFKKRGKQ